MASFKESMSRMAQSAAVKSKELAEIRRLNSEISDMEQQIRVMNAEVGKYMMESENPIEANDEFVCTKRSLYRELNEKIEKNRQMVKEIKSVNICPNCGAEVARTSRYCDRCGTEMVREVMKQPTAPAKQCPKCGQPVDSNAPFCGSCGAKLDE